MIEKAHYLVAVVVIVTAAAIEAGAGEDLPVAERWEILDTAESGDLADGANMLRNYPGPQAIRILTELLDDPGEREWSNGGGALVRIDYPVRKAAYDSLLALGEKPEKPLLQRLPTAEEVRDPRDRHREEAFRGGAGRLVSPYPGGSPFPPGKEPSLTHIVKVYWTTLGAMVTRIDVKAEGERPTQIHCVRIENGKESTVHSAIAPDCDYTIRLASIRQTESEGVANWVAEGQGTLTIRVHGFRVEDFDNPPVVRVRYLKNGAVVGETSVESLPVPEALLQKEAATKSIPELIRDLTSNDRDWADAAKWELGRRGKPAVAALIALVKDRTAKGRDLAVISLGIIEDPETVPFLIECLDHEDPPVRGRAAYALSQIGSEQAGDALVAFLEKCLEDKEYRQHNLTKAAESLKELPDPRAFCSLMTIVDDALAGRRQGHALLYAAEALGKIGDPRASGALAKLLDPKELYWKSYDCLYLEAILKTKGPEALPDLVSYLEALVAKIKDQPEPAGMMGKGNRQKRYNYQVYNKTTACLEAITGQKPEGATREEVLKYWQDYLAKSKRGGRAAKHTNG